MPREAEVQREILRLWGAHPRVRLWRANAGRAMVPTATGGLRPVQVNIPGCPDIIGWIAPHGRFVGIECKSDRGKLRPEQIAFRDRLVADGGVYIVARRVADVDSALGRLVG